MLCSPSFTNGSVCGMIGRITGFCTSFLLSTTTVTWNLARTDTDVVDFDSCNPLPLYFFSYARYRPPKRILYNTVHIVHPKLKHNVVWVYLICMMRGKSIWNLCNTWRTCGGRWGTWVRRPDIFGHGLVCRSGHWPHFLRSLWADDSRHEWEKSLLGPVFLRSVETSCSTWFPPS